MPLQFFVRLLLLLFISINGFSTNPTTSAKNSNRSSKIQSNKEPPVMHFEMIHKHAPEILGGRTLSRSERIKELVHGDKVRREMISYKHKLKRKLAATSSSSSSSSRGAYQLHDSDHHAMDNSSFSLPMLSGFYAQSVTYYVPFKVGTPAQKFLLVADTGSDLTWMNCKAGSNQNQLQGDHGEDDDEEEKKNGTRIFHPERSQTFRTIPCSSRLCRQSLYTFFSTKECPAPKAPCRYQYSYADGTEAEGIFAYDSVTVNLANGRKKKIPGMLMGCTSELKKQDVVGLGNADGVFGLGFNTHAFVFNVFKAFRGKFSYCLMDHTSPKNVYNYLTFGHRSEEEMPPNMQFTELILIDDFYGITVDGIYVDGVRMDIPDVVWNLEFGNGMIIDSGSSLTSFAKEAYDPIMAAIERPLLGKFPRAEFEGFESCFNVTNTSTNTTQLAGDKNGDPFFFDESVVPRFEIELKLGARLKPPVKSYFIEVDDGLRCIGFTPVLGYDQERSVLGNIMQQNHLWEFNAFRSQLGFAPSTCLLRHHHKF